MYEVHLKKKNYMINIKTWLLCILNIWFISTIIYHLCMTGKYAYI